MLITDIISILFSHDFLRRRRSFTSKKVIRLSRDILMFLANSLDLEEILLQPLAPVET